VNNELAALKAALPKAIEILGPGGRFVVISYHSLEDRIVKQTFSRYAKGCICPADFPVCRCGITPSVKLITRKVVKPGVDEVRENPRSRSAKMRVCEKLEAAKLRSI
jgi:16S rRNA (cytosine1402-N4)-methyltransferase